MNTPKKSAPYKHLHDGSDCYTKNCSRNNRPTSEDGQKTAFLKSLAPKNSDAEPTFIDIIAPQSKWDKAVANNEVTRQRHPVYPYSIYKYSLSTNYSHNWNDITRAARGLVVNDETGEIMARPFSKFFNYGEGDAPLDLMYGPVSVTEKLDGSLGISFLNPDGEIEITTAGVFQSQQAAHANEVYRERYAGKWNPRPGYTYMWEIIYPGNRIVVDYEKEDDIHLIGATSIATGRSLPLSQITEWKWKRAEEFTGLKSLDEVIGSGDRPNHEGYIVHYTDTDARVKFKHEEYVRHHRVATGVNSRRVWENLKAGGDESVWLANIPEEFMPFVTSTKDRIRKEYNDLYASIKANSTAFIEQNNLRNVSQKEAAHIVQAKADKSQTGYIFSFLKNGDLNELAKERLWDNVKPPAEDSLWQMANKAGYQSDPEK